MYNINQRRQYSKLTSERKAEVEKRALEHGKTSTICYYPKRFTLKTAVANMENLYTSELRRKRAETSDDMTVRKLQEKKRGHPLLLGEEIDKLSAKICFWRIRENFAPRNLLAIRHYIGEKIRR